MPDTQPRQGGPSMTKYVTRFGSLKHYGKGGGEIIDDDPRRYAFSNMFEVASRSKPSEKVAVGKNMQYVLEVIRAEGTSEWRAAPHDEFALVMDGEVEVRLWTLAAPSGVPPTKEGSIRLRGEPTGRKMGVVRARRGHMTLLPAGAASQFHANRPGVIRLQTIVGDDTHDRSAERC